MVVRETAVHLAVELGDLAAEAPIKPRREHAGDAVSAIDGDVEAARELHVARDALDVGIEDVRRASFAFARGESLFSTRSRTS